MRVLGQFLSFVPRAKTVYDEGFTASFCQALIDWFLLLLVTTGLVLERGGLFLDWSQGGGGSTGLDTL